MEEPLLNPDRQPVFIPRRHSSGKRGRLKVFFGMSAGVGKTRAMLEAARREQAAGRDVVIGCLGNSGGEEKDPLAEGLPAVTPLDVMSRGRVLAEMDLDAVLARRPELVLVDQLAHSNAGDSRHPKRYQDVIELLNAGIHVFTTLNVQNVESRAEAVRQITGANVQETVPDAILEEAAFELVDLPVEELRTRLAADGRHERELAWAAQQQVFRPGSLSALRELTLRFVAEHVGRDVISSRRAGGTGEPWKSGRRLIVGVSPDPNAAALIRWTRHLAGELHATWLAVHVETRGHLNRQGQTCLARALAQASHVADLLAIVTEEVDNTSHAEVMVSLAGPGQADGLEPCPGGRWSLSGEELKVAAWAFHNRQAAGHGTSTTPSAEGLHLPLLAGERALGVLSLRFRDQAPLTTDQRELLDAFVRHIALALDRERLREAEQRAKLVAESERLSKALLNSISHEMRTPLAAITSAASTLGETSDALPRHLQKEMADEIQEAAQRLNRLVGNLLNMTRLETGHVKPKLDWCDVEDLVQVTLDDIENDLTRHRLAVEIAPGLPLVRMDFVLMQQVITNLLLNAAVHTPAGTTVHLSAATDGGALVLSVADNGPGLPTEALPQLFEKFYRAPAAPAGGTGLGLAIVKGFVEAQGGQVSAGNRTEGGAVFTVRLPSPSRNFKTGFQAPERQRRAERAVSGVE